MLLGYTFSINYFDDPLFNMRKLAMKKTLFTVLALFCIGSATAYIRSTIENQTFHPNGNIKSEVVEINGVKTTKYYDESGILISQGELKNGVEQGMWKYFDKDGNVIFTKHYVNGHIVAEGLGPKK